jgi:hypothetical protein
MIAYLFVFERIISRSTSHFLHCTTKLHTYVYTYVNINIYVYAYIYTYMYIYTYIYIHICIFIDTHILKFKQIYIYIYIYVCIYTPCFFGPIHGVTRHNEILLNQQVPMDFLEIHIYKNYKI